MDDSILIGVILGTVGLSPLIVNHYLYKSNAPIPIQIVGGIFTYGWSNVMFFNYIKAKFFFK